jgi:hypothetical protein
LASQDPGIDPLDEPEAGKGKHKPIDFIDSGIEGVLDQVLGTVINFTKYGDFIEF